MTDIKWIKLSTDVFDNRKIIQIENMPDGDALLVIWFKLLVLAGQTNEHGFVYFTKDIPYTEQMLANQFRKPLTTIQLALQTFMHFGMIEIVHDVLCVSNWERYQNIDGMDKIREQTRKRVAEYRERRRLGSGAEANDTDCADCNATRNATVTHGNETDTEINKELEINNSKEINKEMGNQEKPKKTQARKSPKEPKTFDDIPAELKKLILESGFSEEVQNHLCDYVLDRMSNTKNYSANALKRSINKIKLLYPDNEDKQIACIDQSIERCWKGIFEVQEDKWSKQNKKTSFGSMMNNSASDNGYDPWKGVDSL